MQKHMWQRAWQCRPRVRAQGQYEQVKSEAAASAVQVEKLTAQLAAVKHEARDLHQRVASLTQQVRTQPRRRRLRFRNPLPTTTP